MKKFRKGFTLVELLIVITILGALAAAMATTSGNATARAKAASIVANVEACKTAAAIYYADNWDVTGIAEATAANFLYDSTVEGAKKYVPNFKDFSTGNITYKVDTAEANGSGKGRDNWGVVVSFASDAEAANVQAELVKAKGYSAVATGKTGFTVNLTTGEIKDITPTE